MKIRWSQNSVRMRITPSELEALQHGETISEELSLPGGSWIATIGSSAADTLTMQGGVLQVQLSPRHLAQLSALENEGVYFGEGKGELRYYIEKDFPCTHPRAAEALEPHTETFAPTPEFIERTRDTC